ncbi:hypothetical protein HanIR_Chr11g0528711 [Helianthus annuus]|nr:hypothetical protein HanIR_Chr11g0528711 [Helianthus annuus]
MFGGGGLLVLFCDEGGRRLLVVLNACRGRRRVLVVVALRLVAVGVFWRSRFFGRFCDLGVSSEGRLGLICWGVDLNSLILLI